MLFADSPMFQALLRDIGAYAPEFLTFCPSHFAPEMGPFWAISPLGMIYLRVY